MAIFINPYLFLALLGDTAMLVVFAIEDIRYNSISKRVSYAFEVGAIILGLVQFYLVPEISLIMLIVGLAAFFMARRYYKRLMADLDQEVSLITLCNCTYIALPAMLIMLGWTAFGAYIDLKMEGLEGLKRFAAMGRFGFVWLAVLVVWLLTLIVR